MVENSKFFPWHPDRDSGSQGSPAEVSRLDNCTVWVTSLAQGAFLCVFTVQLWHSKVWGFYFLYLLLGILSFWIVLNFSLQWGDERVAELQLAIVLQNTQELPALLQLSEKSPLSWLDLSLIIGLVFLSFSELLLGLPYQYWRENVLSLSLVWAIKVRDDGSVKIHISIWPLYA